jgi:nitrate/nitrite transporter NarK
MDSAGARVSPEVAAAPARVSLALPCFAAASQSINFISHAALAAPIMAELGISPAQAGLLSTAMFAVGGLAAVPVGGVIDRLGARPVMALSLVLLAASTLALAAATSFPAMLLIRAGGGFGVTATFIAGGQYVSALAHRRPYLAQGFLGGSIQLGLASGVFVLPAAAGALGWRTALAWSALPACVALVVWLLRAPAIVASAPPVRVAIVLSDAAVWRLAVAHTAMYGLAVVIGGWATVYLAHEFGTSLGVAGVLGSLGLLLGVIARPVGGLLVATGTVSPRTMILTTLAAGFTGTAMMAWPERSLAAALLGMAILGWSASLGYAAVITLATRIHPDAAGTALGIIGGFSMTAIVVGAPLAGALYGSSGSFTPAFGTLALLPALALLACWGLRRDG